MNFHSKLWGGWTSMLYMPIAAAVIDTLSTMALIGPIASTIADMTKREAVRWR